MAAKTRPCHPEMEKAASHARPKKEANKSEGGLQLILSKREDVFIARISSAGTVELCRTARADFEAGRNNDQVLARGTFPAFEPGTPRIISFENADYRVRLRVDGRIVLETTDAQYHPDPEALRASVTPESTPIIRIAAEHLNCELWHLRLLRDIYYQSTSFIEQRNKAGVPNPLYGKPGHGIAGNPIRLGPREYFVLGDNSPMSKDSRAWWEIGPHLADRYKKGRYHLGTVPADQMVGKAFIVYLPAPFRLFATGPAVIPNLKEIRFIK